MSDALPQIPGEGVSWVTSGLTHFSLVAKNGGGGEGGTVGEMPRLRESAAIDACTDTKAKRRAREDETDFFQGCGVD